MLKRIVPRGWGGFGVVLVMLPVLGLLLSIAGELVPDRRVASAIADAAAEGLITGEDRSPSGFGGLVGHHSECIGLTTGLGDRDRGIIEVAIVSPNLGRCSIAVNRIQAWREGGELNPPWDYLRYWHSYAAFTRPMTALFGVEGVRLGISILLLGSMLVFYLVLARRAGHVAGALFMTPFVLGSDLMTTPLGGPHGMAAAAVFATGALTLAVVARDDALPTVAIVSAVAAGILVLVDVLTMGTVSWTLTAALVGFGSWTLGRRGLRLAKPMTVAAAAWVVAYTTTWTAKWMVAGLVIGFGEVWTRISDSVAIRVAGDVDYIELGLGNTTHNVLGTWWLSPLGKLLTFLVIVWMGLGAYAARRSGAITSWLVLSSPVLIAVVWFEIMQNHTQVHRWFTAGRGVAVCAAVLMVAAELMRRHARDAGPAREGKPMSSAGAPPAAYG